MNSSEQKANTQDSVWFYEKSGERIGGISEEKIITLINTGALSYGSCRVSTYCVLRASHVNSTY